ncbi:MAG: symmetrical bis(5'-nucleosyl)-tetraphosphatase [Steroidobacteraceae bacterium]
MPRYAIGDIQGCYEPLRELLRKLDFSPDRDQLLLVGDLVNRGPDSLDVLRLVRSLGAAAQTVLGNHDLHLLALHHDAGRRPRPGDTFDEVLAAPDREVLLDWLIQQPLIIDDPRRKDLLVHAGIVPEWTRSEAIACAREASRALRAEPRSFLASMYGNKPDRWRDAHTATERHRFTINVLTRLRYCRADGTIDLKLKGAPDNTGAWRPWFEHARQLQDRRVVFGHWSTLGLLQRADLLALDTGCVWGGALTAVDLDDPDARPVQVRCEACQQPDEL